MDESQIFEVAIVGSGPAGLTAAIYASRYLLKNIVFGSLIGGEVALSADIENYPGFKSIKGFELAKRFQEQVLSLGSRLVNENVKAVEREKEIFKIRTENGRVFTSRGVILAAGSEKQKLNVKGENEYTGKGVSFCTTCDGMFFKDKVVAVLGGGDAAISSAILLSEIAKHVYLIYRRKKENLRAEPMWIQKFEERVKMGKAEFIFETNVIEILGDGQKVNGLQLDRNQKILKADGVFIQIGSKPETKVVSSLDVKTDKQGYIVVEAGQKTNIEGLYAAGDITTGSNKFEQIITAAAEGAVAAASISEWLKKSQK